MAFLGAFTLIIADIEKLVKFRDMSVIILLWILGINVYSNCGGVDNTREGVGGGVSFCAYPSSNLSSHHFSHAVYFLLRKALFVWSLYLAFWPDLTFTDHKNHFIGFCHRNIVRLQGYFYHAIGELPRCFYFTIGGLQRCFYYCWIHLLQLTLSPTNLGEAHTVFC
jgi:hypothetical protein